MAYRAAVAVLNKITSNKDIFLQSSFLHLPFTFFFFSSLPMLIIQYVEVKP